MATPRVLQRQTFTISRELEYFSESELTTQTGYERDYWWPFVVVKEAIDNSLDGCEQGGGVPPVIEVQFSGDSLTIADNGPGIAPEVLERILDFSTSGLSRSNYYHERFVFYVCHSPPNPCTCRSNSAPS